MFRIKICGVTRVQDAAAAAQAGADAIGLNFHPASKRRVTPEQARAIVAAAPEELLKVGVFVNVGVDQIREIVAASGIQAVQLHGEEPEEWVRRLAPLPVIRAFRLPEGGWSVIQAKWEQLLRCGPPPAAVLIDGYAGAAYGGEGIEAPWSQIPPPGRRPAGPLILAGGLHPANVAQAIAAVSPDGVDVASGVEASPGVKDPRLMREFAAAAGSRLPNREA